MIIVHTHLYQFQGGSKMILELCKEFVNHEPVTLVIDNGNRKNIQLFSDVGVSVINLKHKSTNSFIYWLLLPYFILLTLNKVIHLAKQHQVVLSTTYPSHLTAYLLSKMINITFFAYCFEPYPFFYNKPFRWSISMSTGIFLTILSVVYSWTDKLSIRKAKKTFTLNKVTQQTIREVYGIGSTVTLMGVDSKHFCPQKSAKFTMMYPNRPIIAHSTDYSTMKNTDYAVRIMDQVIKKHPEAVMLITSTRPDAPEKQNIIKMVDSLKLNNSVYLLDLIEYYDLPILYSNAVCYLSVSNDRMFGTTSSNLPVKEALACGTPALRANITTEDVVDGISGFLVDPANYKQVANKISYLIDHPDKAKTMGAVGRRRIVKEYRWEYVAENILVSIKERYDKAN